MSDADISPLLKALVDLHLLTPVQVRELPAAAKASPAKLADELEARGWATRFQATIIRDNKPRELTLGGYLLVDKLGEGGMGVVYKAQKRLVPEPVALKVIRTAQATPEALRRFIEEIKAAFKVRHDNIVWARDAGEDGDTYFLVMEYVEGSDLARHIANRGRLPVAEACDYLRQAALGLHHAHEKGLVHRDIKPSNLLLDKQGKTVKIVDLGLARLRADLEINSMADRLTRENTAMGTPDYLAPEQARDSARVDRRADIYGLGCTAYHLLTGRVPFPGGTLTEKLIKHMEDQPELIETRCPDVPTGLAAVVRRMMAKKPDDRYQTAKEVADALFPFTREGAQIWQGGLKSWGETPGTGPASLSGSGSIIPRSWPSVGPPPPPPAPSRSEPNLEDRSFPTMAPATPALETPPQGAMATASYIPKPTTEAREPPAKNRGMLGKLLLGIVALGIVAAVALWQAGIFDRRAVAPPSNSGHEPVEQPLAKEPLANRYGIIEVTAAKVRALAVTLAEREVDGRLRWVCDPETKAQKQVAYELDFNPATRLFDARSVAQVVEHVRELASWLKTERVPDLNVWTVIGSGTQGWSLAFANQLPAWSGGNECVLDLRERLAKERVGGVSVETMTPDEEIACLAVQVVPKGKTGDALVLDVGRDSIKSCLVNSARDSFPKKRDSIHIHIPGTRSLDRWARQVSTPPADADLATPELRTAYANRLRDKCKQVVAAGIGHAVNNGNLTVQDNVYLLGEDLWPMRFVLGTNVDFEKLRSQVIEKGAAGLPVPVEELLAAAEILRVLNMEIDLGKHHQVTFVDPEEHDWLYVYLERQVNRERRP